MKPGSGKKTGTCHQAKEEKKTTKQPALRRQIEAEEFVRDRGRAGIVELHAKINLGIGGSLQTTQFGDWHADVFRFAVRSRWFRLFYYYYCARAGY